MDDTYKIVNAYIEDTYLGEDHGCLTFYIHLQCADSCVGSFGGRVLAYWKKAPQRESKGAGILASVLNTVGVTSWEKLKGSYCRVKTEGWGGKILAIGNLMKEDWFDFKEYIDGCNNLIGTKEE